MPSHLLIFEFFELRQCLFWRPFTYYSKIFLITCTEIYDLNKNIPISKFQQLNMGNNVKNMWKKIYALVE